MRVWRQTLHDRSIPGSGFALRLGCARGVPQGGWHVLFASRQAALRTGDAAARRSGLRVDALRRERRAEADQHDHHRVKVATQLLRASLQAA